MTVYRLRVPGLVCECALESIERSLRAVTGVLGIRFDAQRQVVSVETGLDCDSAGLVRAVERTGYQVGDCATLAEGQETPLTAGPAR